MRTTIELDELLISEAYALTSLETRNELINFALLELVSQKRQSANKSLCDAFRELHQLELTENPFPEVKRDNRPNPFT